MLKLFNDTRDARKVHFLCYKMAWGLSIFRNIGMVFEKDLKTAY